MPTFADYLSLAFRAATAFSPTDVSAIKRWAKLLVMMEAVVSLGIGALVVAFRCGVDLCGGDEVGAGARRHPHLGRHVGADSMVVLDV